MQSVDDVILLPFFLEIHYKNILEMGNSALLQLSVELFFSGKMGFLGHPSLTLAGIMFTSNQLLLFSQLLSAFQRLEGHMSPDEK